VLTRRARANIGDENRRIVTGPGYAKTHQQRYCYAKKHVLRACSTYTFIDITIIYLHVKYGSAANNTLVPVTQCNINRNEQVFDRLTTVVFATFTRNGKTPLDGSQPTANNTP
jgi:hypothetical protein